MESNITHGNNIKEQQQKGEITRSIIKLEILCKSQFKDFKEDKFQQYFRRVRLEMN